MNFEKMVQFLVHLYFWRGAARLYRRLESGCQKNEHRWNIEAFQHTSGGLNKCDLRQRLTVAVQPVSNIVPMRSYIGESARLDLYLTYNTYQMKHFVTKVGAEN